MCSSSSPDSAVVPVEVDVLNRAEVLPVLDELDGGAVAQQVEPGDKKFTTEPAEHKANTSVLSGSVK